MCEAPGAFVAALNHYLKLNYPDAKFNWCATTLNPYYEGNSFDSAVLDDRLMVRTFDNWEFGTDWTGDITNEANVKQLVERCRKMGKVTKFNTHTHTRVILNSKRNIFFVSLSLCLRQHFQISLVTADGSVDCMQCPHDQENKVHYLHFAEVVAALQILDMGGTFVLKMFTFFELTTVGLLYYLVNVFDKVDVFKPAASKQGNSEVYVICSGYQRIYKNLNYLLEMTGRMKQNDNVPLFSLDMISDDFIEQVGNCAKMFMQLQTEAIESNIHFYRRPDSIDEQRRIHELRYDIRREYVRLYGVKSILDGMKILRGESCSDGGDIFAPVVALSGSFTSRLMFKQLTKDEKMLELRSRLDSIEKRILYQNRMDNSHTPLWTNNNQYFEMLKVFYGHPIQQIVSSKFVLNQCLKLMLEILENSIDSNDSVQTTSIISITTTSEDHLTISISIAGYKNIEIYDKFEKEIFHKLVKAINLHSPNKIRIENFLLLTHFAVGLVYALGCVYKEIRLTGNGEIHLNHLRATGKDFLNNILMNRIEFVSLNPNRSVLSFVNVKLLRNNKDFNDSIVHYNNRLSLIYCKTLLMDEC